MGKFVLIIISWRSFTSADATENHTQKLCTNKAAAQAVQCHSMTVQMLLTTTWTHIAHRCAMPSSAVCQNALLCGWLAVRRRQAGGCHGSICQRPQVGRSNSTIKNNVQVNSAKRAPPLLLQTQLMQLIIAPVHTLHSDGAVSTCD